VPWQHSQLVFRCCISQSFGAMPDLALCLDGNRRAIYIHLSPRLYLIGVSAVSMVCAHRLLRTCSTWPLAEHRGKYHRQFCPDNIRQSPFEDFWSCANGGTAAGTKALRVLLKRTINSTIYRHVAGRDEGSHGPPVVAAPRHDRRQTLICPPEPEEALALTDARALTHVPSTLPSPTRSKSPAHHGFADIAKGSGRT